jgi:peptidyl-prolyl cis-trans isomerase C
MYCRRLFVFGITPFLIFVSESVFGQAADLEKLDIVLRSVPDGPIAKVNGTNILAEEFVSMYAGNLAMLAMSHPGETVPEPVRVETGLHCISVLVQRELLYQEAQRRNLTVADDELDKAWQEEIEQIKREMGPEKGAAATEADILARNKTTREIARTQIRKSLMVGKLREIVAKESNLTVPDAEVAEFYDKKKELFRRSSSIHLKQVFVASKKTRLAPSEKDIAEARKVAEGALVKIRAGESFESVAKALSQSPDRDAGGDMGEIPEEQLPPFYLEKAKTMQPGQVSDIIQSEFGFHIIQLVETKAGSDLALEEAKPKIQEVLLAEKLDRAVEDFCRPLGEKAGAVQVYLQLDKTVATMYPDKAAEMRKKRKEVLKEAAGKAPAEAKKPVAGGKAPKNGAKKPKP